jgi:hypothetical protein
VKTEIKYIELKTGYADNGPAWIGQVEFSKSGKTMYFNNHALKGNGHGGCRDLETGEIYWVSGVKKNEENRHWAGNGKIMVDKEIVDQYLQIIGKQVLDTKIYELVEIDKTDKHRFNQIENENIESIHILNKYQDLEGISIDELTKVIEDLKRIESYTNPNNGKKFITVKRLDAEKLLETMYENIEPDSNITRKQ